MDRDLFLRDFSANVKTLKIDTVRSLEIHQVAESFSRSIDTAMHLLQVPRLLILIGLYREEDLALFTQALVVDKAYMHWPESETVRQAVAERVRQLAKERKADEVIRQNRNDEVSRVIERLISSGDVSDALQALAFSAVSTLWTSFECLAKDVWEAALNSRSSALGQSALSALQRDDSDQDISRRSIAVGVLARYGFDLRHLLGTVLLPKFDFTSVSGIRVAFRAAFGKQPSLEALLMAKSLDDLEAARHVIVHRSGKVDGEYLRRTGKALTKGTVLSVSATDLSNHLIAVADSGTGLVKYIDEWLVQNPSSDEGRN